MMAPLEISAVDRAIAAKNLHNHDNGPGGGGVLRFGSDGGVAAEAAKPIPIFKGQFWRKRVPIIKGEVRS